MTILPPEPAWSASLYCEGQLEEALREVLIPFRRTLAEAEGEEPWGFWYLRYGRGGEHLKLRFHGQESRARQARQALVAAAEHYLRSYHPRPEAENRERSQIPAIDAEDELAATHPDGSLLWTQYRRSHVTFGGPPLLQDDDYIAAMVRCLVASSDATLALVEQTSPEALTFARRHNTLLRRALDGLAALGLEPKRVRAYLTYHRNWLLRYVVIMGQGRPETAGNLLSRFNQRVNRMGEGREILWRATEPLRQPCGEERGGEATAPLEALVALLEAAPFPTGRLDPFTEDPIFPPLFKLFHNAANQLGIGLPDEAYLYHSVLCGMLQGSAPVEDFAFEPSPAPSQ